MTRSKGYANNSLFFLLVLLLLIIISSCSKKLTVSTTPATSVDQFAFERDLFKTYVNEEITPLKGDFRVTVQKYNEAQAKFGSSKDTLIQNKIKELKGSINNSLPFNFKEAQLLEHFVSDTLTDDEIAANYYLQLINLANYEGKLKESLHYDSLMKLEYAAYMSDSHNLKMDRVAKTYAQLTELANKGLKEDEYLWETGLLYSELFTVTGPFDKGYPVLSYPFSFFRKLLRQYPDSPFADDADYQIMISYDKPEDRTSSADKFRWIENYTKFMSAYPTTNYTPDIYFKLAKLNLEYADQAELSDSQKMDYYNESRRYIDQIFSSYPDFAKATNLTYLNEKLNSAVYNLTWSFQIRTDKKEFLPGEPIVVTYDLKNTDNKAKRLPLTDAANYPNFITYVEYYPLKTDINRFSGKIVEFNIGNLSASGIYYSNSSAIGDLRKDTLIGSNKRYVEKWDILKTCRSSFESGIGKYNLLEEGNYRITSRAFADFEGSKQSNSVWIIIRRNPLSN